MALGSNTPSVILFSKVCRCCLSSNYFMTQIFQNFISEFLEDLVAIQVKPKDGFPSSICKECLGLLASCVKLKQICQNSDEILRQHFNNDYEPYNVTDKDFTTKQDKFTRFLTYYESIAKFDLPDLTGQNLSGDISRISNDPCKSDDDIKLEFNLETDPADQKNTVNAEVLQCTICIKTFETPAELCRHLMKCEAMAKRSVKKKFVCEVCQKRFAKQSKLFTHQVIHHGKGGALCSTCKKAFVSKEALKAHERIHTGERPYSCKFCTKTFITTRRRAYHIKTRHKTEVPSVNLRRCQRIPKVVLEAAKDQTYEGEAVPIESYKSTQVWLEYGSHVYVQRRERRGVREVRCWVDDCPARARISLSNKVLAILYQHDHLPVPWVRQRNEMYQQLRQRSINEATLLRTIYDQEAERYPEGAAQLPFPESTMRKWRRTETQAIQQTWLNYSCEDE